MGFKSLSANTLFHFTDHIDNLESILRNEFYPNYSLENWDNIAGGPFEIAIPMVCFCDIPLSQIKNHTNNYGKYALGLTKDWGMRNNICPVLYTFHAAQTTRHIMDLFTQFDMADLKNSYGKTLDASIINLSLYVKPYEGKLMKRNKLRDNVRFYDEREWRFIPAINETKEKIRKWLHPNEFNDKTFIVETEKLKKKKISFEPTDIKYIIVEKECEVLKMVHTVREIKSKFSLEEKDKLTTRIISMEHIREDF